MTDGHLVYPDRSPKVTSLGLFEDILMV